MRNVDCVINAEAADDAHEEHLGESELPVEDLHKGVEGHTDREEDKDAQKRDHDVLRGEQKDDEAEGGRDDDTVDGVILNSFLSWNPTPGIVRCLHN